MTKLVGGYPVNNLFAYYRFNNNSVDQVNAYDGVNFSVSYNSGKSGNAIDFLNDSTPRYTSLPNISAFEFTNGINDIPFSVSFYVYFHSFSSTGNWICNRRDGGLFNDYQFVYWQNAINFMKFDSISSNFQGVKTLPSILNINTWYHLVFTDDGSQTQAGMEVYIDSIPSKAVDISGGTYNGMKGGNVNVDIGVAGFSLDQRFKHRGLVDGLGWWNVQLTQAQVTAIYNKQNSGSELI